ncbi:trigger factor [Adlercreutzia sp. ZJ473]|uniref:trigger factor n=1 Tax=Adlercreutzia sp. ZJ473 TaxID=2722822 RepID=UPI001553FE6B|nr:trigger factor [Adlercreutzia sp. ZJ473]
MKVNQKKLEPGKVRLEAVATVDEVSNVLQAAHVAFAQSMGLQPQQGKTVAEVAEEHMGIKNLDSIVEASAIEALVPLALDKKNIVPLFPPKAEPKSPFKRGRQFSFDVEVTLKPAYELSSYDPVEVTVQPYRFNEAVVDAQIEEMSKRYTSFVADDPRPVEKGDSCLIAMKCFEKGEELKGLSTEGRTYTAGKGYMPEGFDEAILGMQPGETKQFTFEGPGIDDDFNEITQVIDCTLTVKEIQKEAVPTIDDEWIAKNMPMYKDLAALRADIGRNLERQDREQYDTYCMQAVASELGRRFQGKIADEAYEAMRDNLVQNLRVNLQQQGKDWEEFVQENGGEQQFGMMLMLQTREMLVQGFALDAVFRHEKLTLTDDDINAACHVMNPQANPKQIRQQFEQSGRGFALRESAERMKANRWALEHAIVKHPEEAPAAAPEAPAAEEAAE